MDSPPGQKNGRCGGVGGGGVVVVTGGLHWRD